MLKAVAAVPLATLGLALALDLCSRSLGALDGLADHAAVQFDLRFTGTTARADAAALALQVRPPPHQSRAHVLHAGQFHLQLALMAAGPLGKYFENQKCPLVDRQTDMAFEIALLRRAQGLIKQDFLCTVLLSQPFDLVCLPAAYKQCGVGCLPLAGQARNRGEPGGLRQQAQLLKFGIEMRQTKIHTHQYGARGWRDGGISQTQFGSCSEDFRASRRARGHRTISLRQARHLRSQQS
jgi:hypothetical protein